MEVSALLTNNVYFGRRSEIKDRVPALALPGELMRGVPQGVEPLSICSLFVNDHREAREPCLPGNISELCPSRSSFLRAASLCVVIYPNQGVEGETAQWLAGCLHLFVESISHPSWLQNCLEVTLPFPAGAMLMFSAHRRERAGYHISGELWRRENPQLESLPPDSHPSMISDFLHL